MQGLLVFHEVIFHICVKGQVCQSFHSPLPGAGINGGVAQPPGREKSEFISGASTNLFERKKLRWAENCVRPEPVRRSCCNSLLSPLRQDLLPWPNARDLKAAGKNRLGQLHSTEEHQLLEALKSSRSRSNGPTDIISCQAATRNEGNVWAGSHAEGAYCILRKYGITGEKTT